LQAINRDQNRIGLVNGIAVSIHHVVKCPRICPVAFILRERAADMVNPSYAANRDRAPSNVRA
jgi:hypothetical protein